MLPLQFDNVLVFCGTGEVGSAVAFEASRRGAKVWLPMRDVAKRNKWLSIEDERSLKMHRIAADLSQPEEVAAAVAKSGAKAAYVQAVHTADFMRSVFTALKDTGVEHIVFLSTRAVQIAGKREGDIRSIDKDYVIPYRHARLEVSLEELGISHTAIRPGNFASNPLRISVDNTSDTPRANVLWPELEQDPIDPRDIGIVSAVALVAPTSLSSAVRGYPVTGARVQGKSVIYLSGREWFSQHRQWDVINQVLAEKGKPPVELAEISKEQYFKALADKKVPQPVALSLTRSMQDTSRLKAVENVSATWRNVEAVTGHAATSFEDFVKRELCRYF